MSINPTFQPGLYNTATINTAAPDHTEKSALVIYTGGTIGMDFDPKTGSLRPLDFKNVLDRIPELRRFNFKLKVISFPRLIDSSDIKPEDWIALARIVEQNYEQFDGFVILHGTDTMAYSASALSYMFENLSKPVIFTGSQLPIGESRTDARENLISALEIATARDERGEARVRDVCIYFDHLLLKGNRSKKVQSYKFTAFESNNYPHLAEAGIFIDYKAKPGPPPEGAFFVRDRLDRSVAVLTIYPGIGRAQVEAVLGMEGLKGCVMLTFGAGNAPSDRWFVESLRAAVQRGVAIFSVSQCLGGTVIPGHYESSRLMREVGVVSGGDVTLEAGMTKMMHLFGECEDPEEVKALLGKPLRGEMTPFA